jgi:hypothetical protein
MSIRPVYKDGRHIIFKCEDLFYPEYQGFFFVLEKSQGYGYFHNMIKAYTKGEILDNYKIVIK